MKKKLVALSMAALMALSMTVSTIAAPTANDPEIQPRRELCGSCGRMTLFTKQLGDPYKVGPAYVECSHDKLKGYDTVYYMVTDYQAQCTACGFYSEPWSVRTETERTCHGYN